MIVSIFEIISTKNTSSSAPIFLKKVPLQHSLLISLFHKYPEIPISNFLDASKENINLDGTQVSQDSLYNLKLL